MDYLGQWISRRRDIADRYSSELAEFVEVPEEGEKAKNVYQTYVIQAEQRDLLQKFLLEQGIETKIHYPIPIHLQAASSSLGYKKGDFPVAEKQSRHILSLPMYPELDDDQIDNVISAIKTFYAHRP